MLTEKTACHTGRFSYKEGCRIVLKLVFLTKDFYNDFSKCPEIENKDQRPYIRVHVNIGGVLWGIPLRSHISHNHVIWTDEENGCGIDFTKAVVISNPALYISGTKPHLRDDEFKVLKRIDEFQLKTKFQRYIKEYKKAKQHPEMKRNKMLLNFSTLQYFEEYI